jgi:hypothetical protein
MFFANGVARLSKAWNWWNMPAPGTLLVDLSSTGTTRDGNSGMGTGTIFYLWVAPIPDPNQDGYRTDIFPTRG